MAGIDANANFINNTTKSIKGMSIPLIMIFFSSSML